MERKWTFEMETNSNHILTFVEIMGDVLVCAVPRPLYDDPLSDD